MSFFLSCKMFNSMFQLSINIFIYVCLYLLKLKLNFHPGWSEGRRDGRAQPFLPQREGHVLSHAASQLGSDPRDPWLRDCTPVLRATVCLVRLFIY